VFSQKKFKFCVQAYSPPSRPYCLDPFSPAPAAGRQRPPLPDRRRPGSELSPTNRPPLLPRRSPLHGHSSPARRVNSHSSQSTKNPAGRSPRRDFSRTSIVGHWSSAKLKISSPNRPSVPIKGPDRLPTSLRTSTTDFPSFPSPPSPPPVSPRPPPRAAPPLVVDPPLQSTPAQGKERNRLPSSSSSFCPTSRPLPCTGSPGRRRPSPLPPVGLRGWD
jgi:hypothetical protein